MFPSFNIIVINYTSRSLRVSNAYMYNLIDSMGYAGHWRKPTSLCLHIYNIHICMYVYLWASQVALVIKNPPANPRGVREADLILGSGRSPGGGHGNLL